MGLFAPDGTFVFLVAFPGSSANLVSTNLITFDDRADGALNPQTLGDDVDGSDNIQAGTYFAQGDSSGEVNDDGLIGQFNGKVLPSEEVDLPFVVVDRVAGNTGTIVSVELTITCAE